MAILEQDKRGYYLVGWKKFHNKTEALMYASKTNFNIRWVFNDAVYDSIDWTIPIETPLAELYKQRAQQLRDTYDYIILHYSGGQDSNNILHSFIDNNIKLDKIIIQVPEPQRRHSVKNDTSWQNYWGEIDYQAIPYLKGLGDKLKGIEITVQDLSTNIVELLSSEYWIEKMLPNASYGIGVISRSMGQYTSTNILDIVDNGKTSCQLIGIDKPLVYHTGDNYYCYFADQNAYHIQPMDVNLDDVFNKTVTEFFYWTPDMPEIVVKQAQEIKKSCESNLAVKELFSKTTKADIGLFRQIMQSIIYDNNHAPTFQTMKPNTTNGEIIAGQKTHAWFFHGDDQKIVENYYSGIGHLCSQIDNKYYIDANYAIGYQSITSKFYKL
jgi:hypothetical protein